MKKAIICTKDLWHGDKDGPKTLSFTKGQTYYMTTEKLVENTHATNNQGEPHRLGLWYRHFRMA
jgi:hypothetical protein